MAPDRDGSASRIQLIVSSYLLIYFLYQFAWAFYATTVALFWSHKDAFGLELSTTFFIIAFSLFFEALLEAPSGFIADRSGRRFATVLGFLLLLASFAVYFVYGLLAIKGGSPPGQYWALLVAVIAEASLAAGVAFLSGSLEAWMVDAVKADDPDYSHDVTFARQHRLRNVGWLVGGALGLGLYALSDNAVLKDFPYVVLSPWGISILICVLGAYVSYVFMSADSTGRRAPHVVDGGSADVRLSFRQCLRVFWKNGVIRDSTLLAVVSYMLVFTIGYYWATFFRDLSGPAGKSTESEATSIVSYLWVIWLFITLSRILGSTISSRLSRSDYTRTHIMTIGLVVNAVGIISFCSLAILKSPSPDALGLGFVYGLVALLFLGRLGEEIYKPLVNAILNDKISGPYRATMLSIKESIVHGANALVFVVVGFLGGASPKIEVYWLILAVALLVFGLMLIRSLRAHIGSYSGAAAGKAP